MTSGFKAHDVRKLRLCAHCRRPGLLDDMLRLHEIGDPVMLHTACGAATLGRAGLLALPHAEKCKLTVADTGIELMRELLASADETTESVHRQ